jgi:hypothetical protein
MERVSLFPWICTDAMSRIFTRAGSFRMTPTTMKRGTFGSTETWSFEMTRRRFRSWRTSAAIRS